MGTVLRGKARAVSACAVIVILVCGLLLTNMAYAKSAAFVGGWEDTGETKAYLQTISKDNLEYTIHNDKVKTVYSPSLDGTVFYYDGLLSNGQQANLGKAVTFTFHHAGTTVDGRPLDAVFDFTVSLLGREANCEGRPCFLQFLGSDDVLWVYDSEGWVLAQDKVGSGAYGITSADIKTDAKLVYADTGQPFEGGLQICIADLDMIDRTDSSYSESMRLDYGFGDQVYVSQNTKLDRAELAASGNTHFVATRADSNSFLSGFAAATNSGSFGYTWRGTDCGTQFAVRYPNFPSSAVGQPTKSADPGFVEWGDNAVFQIKQKLPYVVSSNKASSISLTDALDPALDASKATVKVTAAGKDATTNWNTAIHGQQVTLTAKDTAQAQGEHIFTISAPIRSDANFAGYATENGYYLIPNQAAATVNGVQFQTDAAKVGVTYGALEISKSSSNPSLTDGNACYSLAGAEYGVYRDQACTDYIGTLTVDENGWGRYDRLRTGTCYVREDKAPEGYWIDENVYRVSVTPMGTYTLNLEDSPINDPAPVIVQKQDAEISSLHVV